MIFYSIYHIPITIKFNYKDRFWLLMKIIRNEGTLYCYLSRTGWMFQCSFIRHKNEILHAEQTLIRLENAGSPYESSSLSWHSGMLSFFDSLIRALTIRMSFFDSLFLLMLFMRLYLARMRLHIIRVSTWLEYSH